MKTYGYLEHRPRYHTGRSKWERIAELREGWRYWFPRSPRNHTRTYGLAFHFGGWCCFRGKAEQKRMRREWRKRARRTAKQRIREEGVAS